MSIHEVMRAACETVGIKTPARTCQPGRWVRTDTLERNGNGDAEVMVQLDGQGVSVVNWQTGQRHTQRINGAPAQVLRRDPVKEREDQAEHREVEAICARIVATARQDVHPYLARKGFPDERGLVHDDPRQCLPNSRLGDAIASAMPVGQMLIVPGRIGARVTTVQFIDAEGAKKNILRGIMSGASHRIATGRETWVCEGIATALSVRAALRLLGRPATVLSAFAASNVAKVAAREGGMIAADHDKPQPTLGGLGAGAYFAIQSGRPWVQPEGLEDFNDLHQREGLRAVAMRIREAFPP